MAVTVEAIKLLLEVAGAGSVEDLAENIGYLQNRMQGLAEEYKGGRITIGEYLKAIEPMVRELNKFSEAMKKAAGDTSATTEELEAAIAKITASVQGKLGKAYEKLDQDIDKVVAATNEMTAAMDRDEVAAERQSAALGKIVGAAAAVAAGNRVLTQTEIEAAAAVGRQASAGLDVTKSYDRVVVAVMQAVAGTQKVTKEMAAEALAAADAALQTNRAADALAGAGRQIVNQKAVLGEAGANWAKFGRTIFYAAQGFEDLQYGVRAVLNNIPLIAMSMGAGPGLAGAVSIVAVGADLLYRNWDKVSEAFAKTPPVATHNKSTIDALAESVKKLGKEADGSVDAMRRLREEQHQLDQSKRSQSAVEGVEQTFGEDAEKSGKAVREFIASQKGGGRGFSDQILGVYNQTGASSQFDTQEMRELQSLQKRYDEAAARRDADRRAGRDTSIADVSFLEEMDNGSATFVMTGGMGGTAPLRDRMRKALGARDENARDFIDKKVAAAMKGDPSAIAWLKGLISQNEPSFGAGSAGRLNEGLNRASLESQKAEQREFDALFEDTDARQKAKDKALADAAKEGQDAAIHQAIENAKAAKSPAKKQAAMNQAKAIQEAGRANAGQREAAEELREMEQADRDAGRESDRVQRVKEQTVERLRQLGERAKDSLEAEQGRADARAEGQAAKSPLGLTNDQAAFLKDRIAEQAQMEFGANGAQAQQVAERAYKMFSTGNMNLNRAFYQAVLQVQRLAMQQNAEMERMIMGLSRTQGNARMRRPTMNKVAGQIRS